MVSKRSSKVLSVSSDQEDTSSTSQPPLRPRRVKMLPRKFKSGVDTVIPGVPTTQTDRPSKLIIQEPPEIPRRAPVDPEAAKRKDKEPAQEPVKPQKKKKKANVTSSEFKGTPKDQSGSQTQTKVTPAALEVLNHTQPPPDFNTEPFVMGPDQGKIWKELFSLRSICPTISVDLPKIKSECNLDLNPWLGQFAPLISLRAPYHPNVVRIFYFNMSWDNIEDNEGNVVEHRITTVMRGKTITLSAASINSILGISNPPPPATLNYDNRDIWQILRPNDPIPDNLSTLSFKPVEMPSVHRAIWYIYVRNLVQKGHHYSTFASKDYPTFASIMDKTPHNLGHWIFQEMARFRFASKKKSYIPFPNLVSVILFHEKVWHLGKDTPIEPVIFGRNQINSMRLDFQEGSGQSRAPSQSGNSRPAASRVQGAQSAPSPPPQSSALDARIKAIVEKAISELTEKIETEVGKLVAEVKDGHNGLVDAQDELKDKIVEQEAKMSTLMISNLSLNDKMDQILRILAPNSGPHSPSFTFTPPNPSTFTPHNPIPPTEIIPPSPTSTVRIDSPPPTPLINPSLVLDEASTAPPFGDDKGGEE